MARKPKKFEPIPGYRPESAQDQADEQLSAYHKRIRMGLEQIPEAPSPADPTKSEATGDHQLPDEPELAAANAYEQAISMLWRSKGGK